MRGPIAVGLTLLVVSGCSENARENIAGESGGTLIVSAPQDPGTLFPPFVETTSAKQITEQIYDYLADVGRSLDTRNENDFRRELADGWQWSSDSLRLSFHLNPRARWHDGRRVTADDVRFTFDLNKNPLIGGRYVSSLENIDSVTVGDSLTASFWFNRRRPTQFLDAAAQLLILPAHQLENISPRGLREMAPPPIGSGRFRLRRREQGTSVEIVADTANYRGRAKLDRAIWSVTPEFTTAIARLKARETDLNEALRPEDVKDLAGQRSIRAVSVPTMDYAFLRFNLRDPVDKKAPHPMFGERNLRRAIAMSTNRNELLRSVFDTFAVVPVGPTVHAYPTTDPSIAQIPFDSVRAGQLFDSLGWTRGADGVRARNGRKLAFTILVPTNSLNRLKMGVLLQEKFRQVGVRVNLERMEFLAQRAREEKGDFDASLDVWTMPSSPDAIRDAWSSSGIGKNGVNYGSYSNPRFDALLDSALSSDVQHARAKFSAAYVVINDDAPAIWLYEPPKILGIHARIRTAATRPDAWWFSLADWYVPVGERLPRDRIPLTR